MASKRLERAASGHASATPGIGIARLTKALIASAPPPNASTPRPSPPASQYPDLHTHQPALSLAHPRPFGHKRLTSSLSSTLSVTGEMTGYAFSCSRRNRSELVQSATPNTLTGPPTTKTPHNPCIRVSVYPCQNPSAFNIPTGSPTSVTRLPTPASGASNSPSISPPDRQPPKQLTH